LGRGISAISLKDSQKILKSFAKILQFVVENYQKHAKILQNNHKNATKTC